MAQPLVSILIPAHNAARWVAESLQSAIDQTWSRKEIILVDDGSSDETLTIARAFRSPMVTVVSQKKEGAAAARNKAFELCQGDYIQWLDADDLLARDKIERQMAAVLQENLSGRILLSGAWGQFMYRTTKARFTPNALWCDLSPKEWLSRKMGDNLHMQTATWLVSRELTGLAGPWDVRLSLDDDGEYFCRVLLASEAVRFIPEAKVLYRAASSASLRIVDGSNSKMESQCRSTILHVQYLRRLEDNESIRSICLKYLQRRIGNFYPEGPDLVDALKELAVSLGGRLETPVIGGKYATIEKAFGYLAAKRIRFAVRRMKWGIVRSCDRLLARLQKRTKPSLSFQAQ